MYILDDLLKFTDTYKSWISIGGPHLSLLETSDAGVAASHVVLPHRGTGAGANALASFPLQALLLIKPGNEPTNAWPRVKCPGQKSEGPTGPTACAGPASSAVAIPE